MAKIDIVKTNRTSLTKSADGKKEENNTDKLINPQQQLSPAFKTVIGDKSALTSADKERDKLVADAAVDSDSDDD